MVQQDTDLISIGVPVFNGERLLPRALDALLAQTWNNLEIIISDNCSTDRTAEIAADYARRDPRIRFFRQERNLGAAANFNFVFHQARGACFKWAAHDDRIEPDYLATCMAVLERDPGVVIATTATGLINEDGSPLVYDAARNAFIDGYGKTWYWSTATGEETAADDPVRRFRWIAGGNNWCLEVFGLIRTEALRRSSLIGSYYGSDKILLAELSTMGRFHRDPRILFLRGCQPAQSSSLTPQEQAAWIRGHRRKLAFDQLWMLFGLMKAGWSPDLTPAQRLACIGCVLRTAVKLEKLKRLVVPGPYNYFGIGAVRRVR
jgi:glycosyltransferase involved in cell wall biosynthesis